MTVVREFLGARAAGVIEAGVARACIALDPGLGFGKSVEQNLALIARTAELAALGFPIVSALSRKSFVGRVSLGRDSTPDERLEGTLSLSVAHLRAGASIFRVHDVAAHVRVLAAAHGLQRADTPKPSLGGSRSQNQPPAASI